MSSARLATFAVIVGSLLAVTSSASAETVAGLAADYGDGVADTMIDDIDAELTDIFDSSSRYDWLPPDEARSELDGDLLDCFDEECLIAIGEQLEAPIGLRFDFDVEREIYEWTVDFYDLDSGSPLATEQGTCELCGRAETLEQFRASVHGNLVTLDRVEPEEPAEPIEPEPDPDIAMTEVQIATFPDDARIFVDDEPVGRGEATIELDEGTHEVRFSHDAHQGLREEIVITEDSAPLFVLRVNLGTGPEEQHRVITRGDGLVDRIERQRPLIGWSAVGVGTALTVASYMLARLHNEPACASDVDIRRCPDRWRTAGIATTTAVVGTLGLATGVTLLAWPLLAGDERDATEPDVSLAPTTDGESAGFSIRGTF